MPTYDYKCSKCEHRFERIKKIAERLEPCSEKCENCEQIDCITLEIVSPNLISPFAVEGLKKPAGDFRDRMKQIKHGLRYDKHAKIKDY